MKTFFKILYIIFALFIIAYINYHVKADNVCETIFGCFALWIWMYHRDKGE